MCACVCQYTFRILDDLNRGMRPLFIGFKSFKRGNIINSFLTVTNRLNHLNVTAKFSKIGKKRYLVVANRLDTFKLPLSSKAHQSNPLTLCVNRLDPVKKGFYGFLNVPILSRQLLYISSKVFHFKIIL